MRLGDESEERVKRMDADRLAKMAKNGRSNTPGHPDGLQNISAKVGQRHRRKTSIKNRI